MKISIRLFCILLISFYSWSISAQSKQPIIWWNMTWNGLRVQQPANEMPVGKAPFQKSTPKAKQNIPAKFIKLAANEWELADGWELIEAYKTRETSANLFDADLDTKDWYNAVVPGTVLTSLVKAGHYPDPYYGLNNLAISDTLCRMDWWYRFVFETPDEIKGKITQLHFNGINYMAEVYINQKMLGTINGAFIRGDFDISAHLNPNGKNVLTVRIIPPFNPGIPHEQSMISGQGLNGGQLCMDGPTFISSEGWDWVPGIRDRNIGIWQDVRLTVHESVEIGNPFVITDLPLPDTTSAFITLKTEMKNLRSKAVDGTLKGKISGTNISFQKAFSLKAGETQELVLSPSEFKQLQMKNPKLWWPNGYGNPNLYTLELTVETDSKLSDTQTITFGVREFSYELMVAKTKEDLKRVEMNPLKVLKNGKPVFDVVNKVKHENMYVPALYNANDWTLFDAADPNDPVGPYFVIKVNGARIFAKGGNWGMDDAMKNTSREKMEPYFRLHKEEHFNIVRNWTGESTDEMFYTLADEYGMLVWNDFWLTTENSNTDPNDHDLFIRNAADAVKRFRNHASIAVWCPRNEGFAPVELETRLAAMCSELDPSRIYHGQSRFLNMDDSGPWGYFTDLSYYYNTRAKGFNTEMGSYAIPTTNTIKKFIAPEDLWPINDVWAYHDLHHTTQNFKGFMEAVETYGKPEGLEDFVRKAQIVNYDNWRAMIEAWNSKMWDDCTGLILWMSHPAWPSMIWQTYTWDYETPASFFGAKKAAEPLHIQMNLNDHQVVIINATRQNEKNLTASLYYYSLEGKLIDKQSLKINAPANNKTSCFTAKELETPEHYLVRLELARNGKVVSVNDYRKHGKSNAQLSNSAYNDLPETKLTATQKQINNQIVLDVKNGNELAISIKLNARNKATGEIILPAYFSDGYFNLLPNEERTITLDMPKEQMKHTIEIIAEGYNMQSHVIATYQD